ncbi:MAG: hypothetical protein KC457_14725, partial [Myxococcales bacterium]|nr:hypothetical protein [Myxococcales bacterium]
MAAETLRERFWALHQDGNLEALTALRAELADVDAPALICVDGLSLACTPSARFCLLRFISRDRIAASLHPHFAANPARPELVMAFVDPSELSYRSFENIIELDDHFSDLERRRLNLTPLETLAPGIRRSTLQSPKPARALLTGLDGLALWAPSPTPRSRGGRRFIFHSERLGRGLTTALRRVLPERLLTGFSHLNPVFRCSRFDPGDERFLPHRDSPYVDPARKQISKHSLLIYLGGGHGEATLRFGETLRLDSIEAMTVMLFDMDLEHEGGPFEDGPKIVLRSELIDVDPELRHSPQLSRTFARACYLSAHSLQEPALEDHARAAYEVAAAARWRPGPRGTRTEMFL